MRGRSFILWILILLMTSLTAQAELDGSVEAVGAMEAADSYAVDDVFDADVVIGYMATASASVNPFLCNDWDLVRMNQLVFEPLVELDENQKPSPMLAKTWEHNGNLWLFTLRSDIVFHNGEPLTAADVESSYQAYLGAGDTNPYYQRITMFIDELAAVDDKTVGVKMKNTGYLAIYAMTFPIVQYATIYDELPRGTGPYWYVRYDIDRDLRIEANPFWWRKAPTVNSIALRRYTSSTDMLEGIQTGQIDMLSTQSSSAALYRKIAGLTSIDYGSLTFEMLVPNLSSGNAMGTLAMRQMVMYAIDRTLIASNAYLGMAIPSEVPILPGTWLYESRSAQYYASPERALYLLEQQGWKDLTGDTKVNRMNGIQVMEFDLRIITYNEPGTTIRENAANMIAEQLGVIGINASVQVMERKEVQKCIRNGTYDLALVGVNLSEIPLVQELFTPGGALDLNNYSDASMTDLIRATAVASTDASLQQAYSQVQMRIVDDLPILGICFRTGVTLSRVPTNNMNGTRALNTWRGIEYSR